MSLIPEGTRIENTLQFETALTLLNKQIDSLCKVKTEIVNAKARFTAMVSVLSQCADDITVAQKALYDSQVTALLHTISLYLSTPDGNGGFVINPVTELLKTTTESVTITFPTGQVVDDIVTLDNMSVDTSALIISVGDTTFTALLSSSLETLYALTPPAFTKSEFIAGVSVEMIKIMQFHLLVSKNEMRLRGAIRHLSDAKTICV